jgi:ISXO2-like transposase domain/Transposase zinc-ribbon domain
MDKDNGFKSLKFKSLVEAIRYFSDPDVCLNFMVAMRFPDGVVCPMCGAKDPVFLAKQRLWQCRNKHPLRQFSIKKNSIMEDSPLPLEKWLPAIWLLTNCKNGISSYEVARALKITQKSAWFMLHRIRLGMQDENGGQIGGEVEVDETFIGGKARFMHAHKRKEKIHGTGGSGKVAVMGLLSRHGHGGKKHSTVRTQIVNTRKRAELDAAVRRHVEVGSEIFTDELPSYNQLAPDYVHNVINHAEQYVRGNVHTNGMENFWSLLKRAIRGTYVSVEPFHLFRYLDEEAFRFNERRHEDGDQGRFMEVCRKVFEVCRKVFGKRLMYKELIGNVPALATT